MAYHWLPKVNEMECYCDSEHDDDPFTDDYALAVVHSLKDGDYFWEVWQVGGLDSEHEWGYETSRENAKKLCESLLALDGIGLKEQA